MANATPMMSFGDAVKTCFSKYCNFNGRARRSEFWWFYLALYIVNSVLGAVLAVIYGIMHTETSILEGAIIAGVGFLWLGIFYLINPDDKLFGGAK